jgi:hypothetical protein
VTDSTSGLSQGERDFYQAHGYVVPSFRFAATDLVRLQAMVASVVESNPKLVNKPIPNPNCPSFSQYGIGTEGGLMEFCSRSDVVDMVESVMGPDVIMWSCTIFSKPAEAGKRTPFHRDGEFWPLNPLETVTLWVAVTESNVGNGCLRLVPGSHRTDNLGRHHNVTTDDVIFGREIDDDEFDPARAIDIELEPGQMVLFDVKMIHGANPNEGNRPRSAFTARYMPGHVRFMHESARTATVKEDGFALSTRPLFLLRGEDNAGNDFTANAHPTDRAALSPWL